MKTQKAHFRSRSIKSKAQDIINTWFVDEPLGKRSRQRRSNSKKNPSIGCAVLVGCSSTFVLFLFAGYLMMGYSEKDTISMLEDEGYDSGLSLKLPSVGGHTVFGPNYDSKRHLKPNPDSLSPTEWDLAFIETPLINLKAWSKSFESCFFDHKLNTKVEIMF